MLFLNTKSHSCNAFDVWYCTGRDGVCDVWREKAKGNHHWGNHDTKWSFVDVQKHHLVSLTQCGGLQWINWRVIWMMGWVWKVVGWSEWEEGRVVDVGFICKKRNMKSIHKIIKIWKMWSIWSFWSFLKHHVLIHFASPLALILCLIL